MRKKRQKDKRRQKNSEHRVADALSGAAYDRLVMACSDLIYSRKDLRVAFKQWLRVVGLNNPARAAVVLPGTDKKNFDRRPALLTNNNNNNNNTNRAQLTPCGSVISGLTMDVALLGGGGLNNNNVMIYGVDRERQRGGTVEDEEELSVDEEEQVEERDTESKEERAARTRIHHKIVATNQLMQQQSEENCISEYIRDYMHTMNTYGVQ